jgi:hypothetical protein
MSFSASFPGLRRDRVRVTRTISTMPLRSVKLVLAQPSDEAEVFGAGDSGLRKSKFPVRHGRANADARRERRANVR